MELGLYIGVCGLPGLYSAGWHLSNLLLPGSPNYEGYSSVKITSVTTRVVNADMRNWVFVKIETNDPGLFGWGEATLEWKTRAVVGAVEDLIPLLIDRDPRDIEQA